MPEMMVLSPHFTNVLVGGSGMCGKNKPNQIYNNKKNGGQLDRKSRKKLLQIIIFAYSGIKLYQY